jgi:hypothetical protein
MRVLESAVTELEKGSHLDTNIALKALIILVLDTDGMVITYFIAYVRVCSLL